MLVVTLWYTEDMTPKQRHSKPLDLGSESIAYVPMSECSATSVNEHQDAIADVVGMVGQALDSQELGALAGGQEGKEGKKAAPQETGGRSDVSTGPPKVTAKPLSPMSPPMGFPLSPITTPSSSLIPDHNGDKLVKVNPLLKKPSSKSTDNPQSDMPVLGVSMGVHQKEGVPDVREYHQVPFTPLNEPPLDTREVKVSSHFITGNERIDRRTAFTQYCRDGESRTYVKVAEMMAVPLESIKKWANEDNWENAYRERATADVLQIAKEDNIHEALDMKREMIALLREKLTAAKNGESVFKSPKEMLDVLRQVEELTGAKDAGSVRAGQIFVIISAEEWEAREAMNEKARKEESNA